MLPFLASQELCSCGDEINYLAPTVEDQGFRSSLVERISREIDPLYKLFARVIDEKCLHIRVEIHHADPSANQNEETIQLVQAK